METIRCKFSLDEQKNGDSVGKDGKQKLDFTFHAVYSADPDSENNKYWEWTPSGELKLSTVNPSMLDLLTPGKEYYIDIIDAEEYDEKIKRMTQQSTGG